LFSFRTLALTLVVGSAVALIAPSSQSADAPTTADAIADPSLRSTRARRTSRTRHVRDDHRQHSHAASADFRVIEYRREDAGYSGNALRRLFDHEVVRRARAATPARRGASRSASSRAALSSMVFNQLGWKANPDSSAVVPHIRLTDVVRSGWRHVRSCRAQSHARTFSTRDLVVVCKCRL
jgi:hypothetical protein